MSLFINYVRFEKCYIMYAENPTNIICIKLYYEFNIIILKSCITNPFKNEFLHGFMYQIPFCTSEPSQKTIIAS